MDERIRSSIIHVERLFRMHYHTICLLRSGPSAAFVQGYLTTNLRSRCVAHHLNEIRAGFLARTKSTVVIVHSDNLLIIHVVTSSQSSCRCFGPGIPLGPARPLYKHATLPSLSPDLQGLWETPL